MQRTLLTATGAAVLSLVSALGLLLMEFLKHDGTIKGLTSVTLMLT